MQTFITVLITILVFGVIIFIHELGNFIAAKLSGITVHEFALGMGPTIFHFEKGGTKYALRLFPIGGFVSMEGEDSESEDEGAFCKKPVWKRIIVVVAGAVMNVLLGFVILMLLNTFRTGGIPTTVIKQFNGTAPYAVEESGLKVGDKILKINGRTMFIEQDIAFSISEDEDKVVDMVVRRDGKKVSLDNVSVGYVTVTNESGQSEEKYPFAVDVESKNVLSVLKYTALNTLYVGRIVWLSLIQLLTGKVGMDALSGPVGVGSALGQMAGISISSLFSMIAFITINVGVFNLLPIPALDGARLVFLIIEGIRRKPVNPKYEGYIHAAGLIAMLLLMVFVTFNDIVRLFQA